VFERWAVYLPAAGLPLIAGLAWLAEPLVRLIFGPQYVASAPIVVILTLAILLVYVTMPTIGLLNSSSAQHRATALLVAAGVTRIGLDLLLIPTLGAWGAAFATVGAEALTAALALPLAWTIVRQSGFLHRIGLVIGCGAAAAGLAWLLQQVNPWLALLGLPCYLALLLICGLPPREDRRAFRHLGAQLAGDLRARLGPVAGL
jgi:O-antigen/teichoic acid export membrane protein